MTESLTKFERVVLLNQYEILKRLDPNADYDWEIEALEHGYVAGYERIFNRVCYAEFTEEKSNFVVNVLCMFEALQEAADRLPALKNAPRAFNLEFSGFDGNNETEYMSYLNFLVDHEKRFVDLVGKNRNSHMARLASYEAMLQEYLRVSPRKQHGLTQSEAEGILAVG